MGLIFAIQPDKRRSSASKLVLSTTKRRFSLGMMVVFVGMLLGLMYLAAAPLFKLFWNEGGFWDRGMVVGFYALLFLFPPAVLFCWFFEEVIALERAVNGVVTLTSHLSFLGVKWGQHRADGVKRSDFTVENWMGAENVASLDAKERGQKDRYATKGHWLLKFVRPGDDIVLERRAKREEIEELLAPIDNFFHPLPIQTIE